MELTEPRSPLAIRALNTLRTRGARYALHKALRHLPGRWATLKRATLYRDPRTYWTLRGGEVYFREQEDHPTRTARSEWMAERIARYRPDSILEIGCGYGKQLRSLRAHLSCPFTGVDFSSAQLLIARQYTRDLTDISLVLADGGRLPFPDDAFDLVLTSAVILHNAPNLAGLIRQEVLRVARRWAAHNEDRDVTYNRFGYDTARWYAERGIVLSECGPVSVDSANGASQFCVANLGRS